MEYEIIFGEWDSFISDNNEYDLIYLDPPFFTQRKHKMEKENGEVFFDDFWENIEEYNKWLKNVVETCWNKLTPQGTIYSHNNFEMNSYLLAGLSEDIRSKFMTNISWQRSHPHNNIKKSWGNIVDSIMVFTKTKNNYFNVQYTPLDEKYRENSFNNRDEKGFYSLAPITGEKSRMGYIFEFNGMNPKYGWRKNRKDVESLHNDGLIHYGKNKPYKKIYLEESKGVPIQNIWTDIFPITRTEENKREYPTQKPIKLLERIITSSCPLDGKVLDPFGGSGTSLFASMKTKIPKYVKIIDKNLDAISIINENINNISLYN
jgi:site-specific DNA-methyltransferase (adenine-specific)/adenine-specific DNA-methyltransferase